MHKNLYIYLFLLTIFGPIYYGPSGMNNEDEQWVCRCRLVERTVSCEDKIHRYAGPDLSMPGMYTRNPAQIFFVNVLVNVSVVFTRFIPRHT